MTKNNIVVLCCSCDKTRDSSGKWVKLEAPMNKSAGIRYSHAICPECMVRLYGTEEWSKEYFRALSEKDGV